VAVLSEHRFTQNRLHKRARQLFMEGGTGTLTPKALGIRGSVYITGTLTPKALGIRGSVYIISVQKATR
jgi:hypothetical protein